MRKLLLSYRRKDLISHQVEQDGNYIQCYFVDRTYEPFIEFIPSYGSRNVFGRMFLLSSSVDPSLLFYRSCSPLRMVPSGDFIFGNRRMILLRGPQFFTGPESQRTAENSDGRGFRTRDLTIRSSNHPGPGPLDHEGT